MLSCERSTSRSRIRATNARLYVLLGRHSRRRTGYRRGREAAVILLISEQSFLQPSGRRLVAAMRAMIDASSLPATLQLDHTRDLHVAAAALDCGVQAVMA